MDERGRKWSEPRGSIQGGPSSVSMCVQGKQVTLTPNTHTPPPPSHVLTPSHPLLQVPTQPRTLTHYTLNDTPSHTSDSHKSHMISDTLTHIHTHTLTQIHSQSRTFTRTNSHTTTHSHRFISSQPHMLTVTLTVIYSHAHRHTLT